MAVFKEFVGTAQREFVAAERQKNPAAVEFRVGAWGWLWAGCVAWVCCGTGRAGLGDCMSTGGCGTAVMDGSSGDVCS